MEENIELARDAFGQWVNAQYREALDSLRRIDTHCDIVSAKNGDEEKSKSGQVFDGVIRAKIDHNIALAEFAAFHSSPRIPAPREDALEKIADTFADVSRRTEKESRKKSELKSTADGKDNCTEEGNDGEPSEATSGQYAKETDENIIVAHGRFQPESSFALYNQAVVYACLRRWRSAQTLLEDIFRYVDALDKGLAICICFLLLDVYTTAVRSVGYGDSGVLLDDLVDRAHAVVDYLEKPHFLGGDKLDTGSVDANEAPVNGASGDNESVGTKSSGDGVTSNEYECKFSERQIRFIKSRLLYYKYLLLVAQACTSLSTEELKLTGKKVISSATCMSAEVNPKDSNYKKGIDDINSLQGFQLDTSDALVDFRGSFECIEANMEYLDGFYSRSMKLLQMAHKNGIGKGIFYNNMGCIHSGLGKHHLASLFFSKALEFYKGRCGYKSIPDVELNLGIQLLHLKKPLLAYEYLVSSAKGNYHRPRLWLHIAECVIMAHDQSMLDRSDDCLRKCVVGQQMSRRIVLNATFPDENLTEHHNDDSKGMKRPLDLLVGLRACNHVLALLDNVKNAFMARDGSSMEKNSRVSDEIDISKESKIEKFSEEKRTDSQASKVDFSSQSSVKALSALSSTSDLPQKRLLDMRLSALLCRAYLALSLENWSLAYSSANQVLSHLYDSGVVSQPSHNEKDEKDYVQNSRSYLITAHSYCAEALLHECICLNGEEMALGHISKAMSIEAEGGKSGTTMASLYVNTAFLRLVNGEVDQAIELISKALSVDPDSPYATRLLGFLYSYQGDHDRTRRILKTMH